MATLQIFPLGSAPRAIHASVQKIQWQDRIRVRSISFSISLFCFSFFTLSHANPDPTAIRLSTNGHWLKFQEKQILLVGDSVTQGWMELGIHFDQDAYVDALAKRGINVLLLWSFIGIVNQESDPRIGYHAPTIWPWVRRGKSFDLTQFNDAYFDRVRDLVRYANSKDIVVIITVHDGWTKTRFSGHPFNVINGGPLTDRSQYVELADPNNEMPATFDPAWGRPQKNQYFLERFCHRLIRATADFPNVMYEIFNEGEWYNQTNLRSFQIHFLDFFKARTNRLTLVNDDHVEGHDFHTERNADVISLHKPNWSAHTSAKEAFAHYVSQFRRSPAKPYFFTEPVPEYSGKSSFLTRLSSLLGSPTERDGLMRLMWGTAMGGAGFVVQNDASFGFDPNAAIASQLANRDIVLDLEGHAARFFNASGVDFGSMIPDANVASTGVALVKASSQYVVYSQGGHSFTVDLSASRGKFTGRFYNPRTGRFQPVFSIRGGSPSQLINKPDSTDWVLHLVSDE